MPRFSEEDVQKVREATDIVSLIAARVDLKPRGRAEHWGCCPFHNERTPSFKVDADTGLWYCFGCQEHGDAFAYLMKTENMSFPEAVEELARRANITLTVDPQAAAQSGRLKRIRAVCADTAAFYHDYLRKSKSSGAAAARAYLGRRGFGSSVAQTWQLGYAPGQAQLLRRLRDAGHSEEDMLAANVVLRTTKGSLRDRFYERIMFPITDTRGQVIAFGGRVVGDGQPKYLNTAETPVFSKGRNLYGIEKAREHILAEKTALVVEGYTDVIGLHAAGFQNAVATLGTALTAQHVKLLSRYAARIAYVFDGDQAGQRAAEKAVAFIDQTLSPEFSAAPVTLDVVMLPGGKDPAEIVAGQDGKASFAALLDTAKPLLTFAIDRRLSRWDLARPEQRQRALTDALSILAPLRGSLLATEYANYIAGVLSATGADVALERVLSELNAMRLSRTETGRVSTSTPASSGGGALSVAGSENGGGDSDTDPQTPAALTKAELIERELLALIIAEPAARACVVPQLGTKGLRHEVYRDVLAELRALPPETSGAHATEMLNTSHPGVAAMVAAYDFSEVRDRLDEASADMLTRLREAQLEAEIRIFRGNLRTGESTAELMQSLITAEQELHQLRATRYN
ncbi:MAG: DNA primase [Actinomycetes bacterium]|jgi:DNA primase|nr:DNA primase [Actinomycetes bacterium]